ncbi:MAG TPA: TIGR03118 family protein [Candidatus Limnocylindrales bacterium]|nr:TIGR03118 family protein [Candidatus Limnocylindrales bacterium]
MLKSKIVLFFCGLILIGLAFGAAGANAQSVAYRQTDLTSNIPDFANNLTPDLINPWGISFLSGQPFFIANNLSGRVTSHDATGLSVGFRSFTIPNATGTGLEHPTGIIADQNSSFGGTSFVQPFIVVTEEGSIFAWGPDSHGNFLQQATLERRRASAVYTGVAILNSAVAQPTLAVVDFNGGFIDTFLPGFTAVALPGAFIDPTLPAGFSPFGIQVIGNQVFVTYAVQDAAKRDPVPGAGNGVVSIFDLAGNFVKRFATGGALNAPSTIVKASANFGPFSNDILIANAGDGTITAFDPASGHFVGVLQDGDGFEITDAGLHGLTFRGDGFGDPNTLYFTSQVNKETQGMFGAISVGLVSAVRITVPNANINVSATITANVAAGPGNAGSPTGTVSFLDGNTLLKTVPLVNGSASVSAIFASAGTHSISAQYSGDHTFLPRREVTPMQVTGLATTSTLTVPADATPGSTILLTATVHATGGVPTGQVTFFDGGTNLGSDTLDGTGTAVIRNDTLSAGTHSLTATYAGDDKFAASTSPGVSVDIDNVDFSVKAAPSSGSVIAGQSTQFALTVTPLGGFAGTVAFSCGPITGVTCSFNPATVTPASGPANTALTVTVSPGAAQLGTPMPGQLGPLGLLFAIALFGFAMWRVRKLPSARFSPVAATAVLIFTLALAIGGCGGYSNSTPTTRRTATVNVTAQSGALSHTTTVTVTVQ